MWLSAFLCGLFYGYLLRDARWRGLTRARIERTLYDMGKYAPLPEYMRPENWSTPCTCSTEGEQCCATFHKQTADDRASYWPDGHIEA